MKSKHLKALLDVVTNDCSLVDYSKDNNMNYKTLTNAIWYGKKLYNKYKRVSDPKLVRINDIPNRQATIMGIQRVYDMYTAGVSGPKQKRMVRKKTKKLVVNNRQSSPLPYHFDTFDNVSDAWDRLTSSIKSADDMSLLIKFYNTIVKESNQNVNQD